MGYVWDDVCTCFTRAPLTRATMEQFYVHEMLQEISEALTVPVVYLDTRIRCIRREIYRRAELRRSGLYPPKVGGGMPCYVDRL